MSEHGDFSHCCSRDCDAHGTVHSRSTITNDVQQDDKLCSALSTLLGNANNDNGNANKQIVRVTLENTTRITSSLIRTDQSEEITSGLLVLWHCKTWKQLSSPIVLQLVLTPASLPTWFLQIIKYYHDKCDQNEADTKQPRATTITKQPKAPSTTNTHHTALWEATTTV